MRRLDTYIGNWGGVRLLGEGGRPSVPPLRRIRKSSLLFVGAGHWPARVLGDRKGRPYGFQGVLPELGRGAPWGSRWGYAPEDGRVRTPAPTGIMDKKQRAHNVRPYITIINGSIYKKRDRSGTCPLKHRGETQFRTKFLCLLSFLKKVRGPGSPPEPLTCVCCKGEGEMGDMYDYWVR